MRIMGGRSLSVAIVGASLILIPAPRARAGDHGRDLWTPPTAKMPADVVERLLQECKTKGTDDACYKVAMDYVQTKDDEATAVEYLRPLCKKDYVPGCVGLWGILFKETETRKEAMLAYLRACTLSTASARTELEKFTARSTCGLVEFLAKNMDADYVDIVTSLGLRDKPRAASFPCAKASTSIEKMICGDKQTSDLDFWVASYYRTAVQISEQPDQLKAEQRAWLTTQRNPCADVKCLKRAYERRLAQLRLLNAPEGAPPPKPPLDDPYPASFVRAPFIRPSAVKRLTGGLLGDGPHEVPVLAIDLRNPKATRQYIGKSKFMKDSNDLVPYVYEDHPPAPPDSDDVHRFGYQWIGRTTSGVDVLVVDQRGAGSADNECVLLVKVELDASAGKNRLLLKKVRVQEVGNRYDGDLRVIGNNVLIGEDKSHVSDRHLGERLVITAP
jgi:uncharacterized protein YecT (DUF1311 family)